MEPFVGAREHLLVGAATLQRRERVGERVEIARRGVRHRHPRHVRLDRLAHLDQLQRARVLGNLRFARLGRVIDEGAAADPARDQRHLLELPQRLAHGAARRAEVLGQVALGRQAFAVRVRALENGFVQLGSNRRRAARRGPRQFGIHRQAPSRWHRR
jgi:hypothetical protein